MRMLHQQRGMGLTSWLMIIMIGIFLGLLGLKAIPVYIEYYEVRSLVDDIAANSEMKQANKRMMNIKLAKYLDMNSLDDHITEKDFKLERIKGSNNRRKLVINYEVRQPWFANLDFVAKFNYEKEIGNVRD